MPKARKIELFNFTTVPMRTFHMTWLAFFLCFFAWFGIAPLTAIVRDEFHLTKVQIGYTVIASVAATILVRLLAGWLCDRIGPRLCYAGLLIVGSIPVMTIGLAHDYQSFLLFRLAIGAIGASFVITQYHTSVMFASNCVGTANAAAAGWGNMGGGAAQIMMPLIFTGLIALGMESAHSWRLAMIAPGLAMFIMGIVYFFFTQDTPEGNILGSKGIRQERAKSAAAGSARNAWIDYRVWILALVYGACFGIEITIHNIAALYFTDTFGLGIKAAGAIVGSFGLLAIFARALGGWISDRVNLRAGLRGRVLWLATAVLIEGLLLIVFSRLTTLLAAVVALILFGLFVHMCCGATYALVPFVNRQAIGAVAGIVGAGGNIGAVSSGFLFSMESLSGANALLILGIVIAISSVSVFWVRFSAQDELAAKHDAEARLAGYAEGLPA